MATDRKTMCIVQPINLLVSDEYDRAASIHGEVFASSHEGYGVIAEEVQETQEELEYVEKYMSGLLTAIRGTDKQNVIDWADSVRDVAVNAAAEAIQVAAMCEKLVKTMEAE